VTAYIAPHTGGESFGIVLIEAMSAGAPVVASDLGAFRRVLRDGDLGVLVRAGDANALAAGVIAVLEDPARRTELTERAGAVAWRYDWRTVGGQVLEVYETVRLGADRVGADPRARTLLGRRRD
jgi:phosphatidyl-myo-inositol alpha-mannosyltransferase